MKNFLSKFKSIYNNVDGLLCDIDIDNMDHVCYFLDNTHDQEYKIISLISNNTLDEIKELIEYYMDVVANYNQFLEIKFDFKMLDLENKALFDVCYNLLILVCRVYIALDTYKNKFSDIVGGDE